MHPAPRIGFSLAVPLLGSAKVGKHDVKLHASGLFVEGDGATEQGVWETESSRKAVALPGSTVHSDVLIALQPGFRTT